MSELKIGDTLYCPDRNKTLKISKVGVKYYSIDGYDSLKVYKDDLSIKTGIGFGGYCYLSESDYKKEKQLNDEWVTLRREVIEMRRNPGLTLEEINQIKGILKL